MLISPPSSLLQLPHKLGTICTRSRLNLLAISSFLACFRSLTFFQCAQSPKGNKEHLERVTVELKVLSFRWNQLCLNRLAISYSPALGICGDQIAKVLRVFGRAIVSLDLCGAAAVRKSNTSTPSSISYCSIRFFLSILLMCAGHVCAF
jgi:hypothetical protein